MTSQASASSSHRGASARMKAASTQLDVTPSISKDIETWAELATLYSSFGLDHFAQVTYSSHIARCGLELL